MLSKGQDGLQVANSWRAEREVDRNGFETGKLWIVMGGEPRAYGFDRYEDATLAAAAPDLLEVLEEILDEALHLNPATAFRASVETRARAAIDRVRASLTEGAR